MSFLPISINIENKKILIIGGGKVGLKKLKSVYPFSKNISVISTEFIDEFSMYEDICLINNEFKPEQLDGFFLVYACTNSTVVNEEIARICDEKNILCNRTDKASVSDFHSVALVDSDNYTIGLNTKARDCKNIIKMKNEIQRFVDAREILDQQKESLKGKVYLVGFGPGNPGLLTRRADDLLYQADVIFYDDLLDNDFLDRYNGEKQYVGKRRGNHSKEQNQINEILYQAASQGKMVVRLKGGDPLIFGRGSEEKYYLNQRNVDVEIIPGISSAIAAAACSNIPLTHRGISSSVSFGTAHGKNSYKLLQSDTSVYYMGANNIVEIAQQYLNENYPEDFPVGLVHNVSLPGQTVTKTTIKELAKGEIEVKSPVISIFGNTVNYEDLI
ncbi:MAG: uroporphyrinogen-III C-methyltransferase [Marinifilaceae bacterium]|jgi:uroporphyrin-III C-methyltransferase/precorrin-2 dehydrogenase/sirohydrochlorin ferrochelatase|nr:uroporphyrinogen-III C-methyltransferase [Marinifilaceae bacterium]